jgi:CheY-like chemotaxis protein
MQILIAEDNHLNQIILTKTLVTMGDVQVTTVDNGQAALNALRTDLYDLVLMDCMVGQEF